MTRFYAVSMLLCEFLFKRHELLLFFRPFNSEPAFLYCDLSRSSLAMSPESTSSSP